MLTKNYVTKWLKEFLTEDYLMKISLLLLVKSLDKAINPIGEHVHIKNRKDKQ